MSDFLKYEIFDLLNVYQLLLIFHLIGLAIGAGAALFSDFLFTNIIKDKKIDKTEFRILKLASSVVWLGLSIMLLSGLTIYIGDSERLLDSSKFLAKMTIIVILLINGTAFHFSQIPNLEKLVNKNLTKNKYFKDKLSKPFFIGGAISGVSWIAALVLGSLDFVDLSYQTIISIYLAVVLLAIMLSLKIRKVFLSS